MRFPLRNKRYNDQIDLSEDLITVVGNRLVADVRTAILFAKASGLRSKKTRKINKRFKCIIMETLRRVVDDKDFCDDIVTKSKDLCSGIDD